MKPYFLRRSTWVPWLWAIGVIVVVAAAGFFTRRYIAPDLSSPGAPDPTTQTSPPRLTAGHDYYLHVKLIEVSERRPDGKAWDRVDDSGPDLRFSLTWQGNVIWNAPEKSNTLIGSWDLLKVDLKQILTSGGQADLENAINAPLIHYEKGGTVELKVWDVDPVGSDSAGSLTFNLDDLQPGENTLRPVASGTSAIRRVVVALIDRKTSVPELMEMISKR